MKAPFPFIDEHLHLYAWSDPATGETFLHSLEPYRQACGLRAINLAALTCAYHDIGNNLLCAFYKLANPDTFAHFFFRSKQPEILDAMFAKYPRISVDLTPGSEMYDGFSARPAYYKDFFTRHADRVLFGTDGSFPCDEAAHEWLCQKIYTFIAMNEDFVIDAWHKNTHGLGVPSEAVRKIFADNFLERVGTQPRPMDKSALKAYLAKYRSWIADPGLAANIDALARKML